MIKTFIYFSMVLLLTSCNKGESSSAKIHSDTIKILDYNIIVAPDLSNRINPKIHPKPVNDTLIISEIINNIETILDIDRKTNQSDKYHFDFINKGILNQNIINPQALTIDFKRFNGKPLDLSNYIRNDLKKDTRAFTKSVHTVYNYSLNNSSGSDIWNYLNETILTSLSRDAIKDITPEGNLTEDPTVIKKTENILILITDGYIENINKSSGYAFNQSTVKQIREEFKNSKSDNLKSFILSHPKYLINPTDKTLSDVNVLVLEIYDRSLDQNGVAKEHPTDFQIMKIVWEKWLLDSGAKNVSINPTVSKKEEVFPIINNFITALN